MEEIKQSKLLDKETERKLAAFLFNDTWRLLEKTDRTPEEDVMMIHSAHASRYHWELVGDASNRAIGEWQISRVYAVLSQFDPALFHAKLCLAICERESLSPFSKGWAHEAMARAFSLCDKDAAANHHAAASQLAATLTDEKERRILESDLKTIAR